MNKKYKVKYNFEDSAINHSTIVFAKSYELAWDIVESQLEFSDTKGFVVDVQLVK